MDLGLQGRKAIVCAASKGLGKACAMSLAMNGVDVVITARTLADLEAAAAEIRRASGAKVTVVAGDITTETGRAAALAACPEPDILVNNAGGPPRGDFRDWGRDDWMKAVDANMITPILMIKAVVDGMIARRFGRIVNITSISVKSPLPELGLSNGAPPPPTPLLRRYGFPPPVHAFDIGRARKQGSRRGRRSQQRQCRSRIFFKWHQVFLI